jgi:hypothetical protein
MKQLLLKSALSIVLLNFLNFSYGQTFTFGSVDSFAMFTGPGALDCIGSCSITGNMGTDIGAINGFGTSIIIGSIHNTNPTTVQTKVDLQLAYDQLVSIPITNAGHAPAFGGGETLNVGVYGILGAGSVGGTLTLDGQTDTNSVFIFRFTGAFVIGAATNIILTNGARPCNIYWVSEGAATVGAASIIKGNFIVNNAAIAIAAAVDIEGRVLSTSGAISINDSSVLYLPSCSVSAPITIPTPEATCQPDIGSLSSFVLFSSEGAVSNSGASIINGDVGANVGIISGFGAATLSGIIYSGDAVTAQAKIDLDNLYSALILAPVTNSSHAPAFGSGETLSPGVYYIGGAGSLAGTLNLNGGLDPNSVFIFRIMGAFTAAASSTITLSDSINSCRVFFISEGACTLGSNCVLNGTFLANIGALTLNSPSTLNGKLLSTVGAITFNFSTVDNSDSCGYLNPCNTELILPIELVSFTSECLDQFTVLEWSTAAEVNNDYFSIEKSEDGMIWETIAQIDGAGYSQNEKNYSFTDVSRNDAIFYYRLKQTDYNGVYSYFKMLSQDNCREKENELSLFPNPANEVLNVTFEGDQSEIISISIFNLLGEVIYYSESFQSKIILGNKFSGVYILQLLTSDSKRFTKKFIVTDL